MKPRSLVSVVPVTHPHNSIYLQAKMMHDALAPGYDISRGVVPAEKYTPADIALVHYGSLDADAGRLARLPGAVFVFHGITPASELLRWKPVVALRAAAGYGQLRILPRKLPWIALSGSSGDLLRRVGFQRVAHAYCIAPARRMRREGSAIERSACLLFVGRISPNKRLLELIDLFERVHDRFPDLTLSIIGPAGANCRYGRAFAIRLEQSRARAKIVWQSAPVSLSELQDQYERALLYVSCSTHEGFGVPAVEAISAGTPAVYVRCGGTESVLDGVGLLTEPDPASKAETICALICDGRKRRALLAAQQGLLARFSRESVGRMLAEAIERFHPDNQPDNRESAE